MASARLFGWIIVAYGLAMLIWPSVFARLVERLPLSSGLGAKPIPQEQRKSRPIFWRAAGLVMIIVGLYFLTAVTAQNAP
jgi:MFS family permease